MKSFPLYFRTIPVIIACAASAHAASIGVNFIGGGNGSSPAISLLSTDSAGVFAAVNWNNVTSANAGSLSLLSDAGVSTTMTLTIANSGGSYSTISGAGITPQGGDEKLNTGFLAGNSTLTLANIPYASYEIYVYALNDNESRVQATTLGGVTYYQDPPNASTRVDQNIATPYTYTRITSTSVGSPTIDGNYVRSPALTGASQTISVAATGNGYITAIQVVQVPEPGSAMMASAGGLALLGWRRRRQA